MQVYTVSNPSLQWQTNLKGAWSESRDQFFKFCRNHIFVIGGPTYFKFRILFATQAHECMRDVLLPKGMWIAYARELVKFWKISENISETEQDKDIDAIEH